MKENNYNVIGVMSGTSLDGIDLAHVELTFSGTWKYKIITSETIPYSAQWQKLLSEAINFSSEKLNQLNEDYTEYLAEVISEFLSKNGIFDTNAICSHGHTIKHEPEKGITLQIGNLPKLADLLQQTVVCDFRSEDVEYGGQGAPLVPIGDELLFGKYDYCLNLGGFANISTSKEGKRIAYDICAVNTVLNWLSQKLNLEYDSGGKVAASGNLDHELLKQLEKIPFYEQEPPKSLGMEWVNEQILPLLMPKIDIPSALHTYVVHIGRQIGKQVKNGNLVVTGGGAFNSFLISQIREHTNAKIIIPSADTVNYKEALIFAFLGVLKLRGEINVYSSVTGASHDHSSGKIYYPGQTNNF
ncbi:anhydro-N-acetylmuramic acid kinase [Salinimicrobium oceani]|uniref:Anhydro-N-acetylmuramic acid kinase n=1 Tax=Salinimicrobium oceani TaxID=2722702 RepID=A0ABX1D4I8_9FLAO|nr:anhydro-N-acetylmuramic acid kinase [Salinimicrobium oceani]NJW53896.1 anhydro-N-acetylmuramic acid kinase [Salinimicrobium oceani]